MNTLFSQIKSEQLIARKNKDEIKASLLTTLIGEVSMVAKNDGNREVTQSDIQSVIKKFLKGTDETIAILTKNGSDFSKFSLEKQILTSFMPQQMTEAEIESSIRDIIKSQNLSGAKSMGVVMKEIKQKYDGRYDGSIVSRICKQILS